MNPPLFEWDSRKAKSNKAKHGISFDEATTAFADPNLLYEYDKEHSEAEDRFIVIGMSTKPRLLMVVFHERHENIIRIISARRATQAEARRYREEQ